LIAVVMLIAPAGGASPTDFEIRDYAGLPGLWWGGLPYFGRFHQTDRAVQDLAGEWRFSADPGDRGEELGFHLPGFDESGWELMAVPGVWNAADSKYSHYEGAAWYRLRFRAGPGVAGGLARLYFDGVCFSGRVWLNGIFLGEHRGGYSAWSLEAGRALRPGEDNLLAVRVDNRRGYADVPPKLWEQEKLGWWPYGGIARLARLEWSGPATLNKLVIESPLLEDGRARLRVSGLVYNHSKAAMPVTVRARLLPRGGFAGADLGEVKIETPARDCARFDLAALELEGVRAWEPGSPELYRLELELAYEGGSERIAERVGFRSFEIKDRGLFLNGRPFWLRGMNRHEDDPETGLYQSDARLEEDLALLHELEVNHLRPGHYPSDPRWLDRLDEAGITVTEEIPLYQAGSGLMKWFEAVFIKRNPRVPLRVGGGYPTLRQMQDQELLKSAQLQLIEMIERDRNHPAIIMWSVGNENFTFLNRARTMHESLLETSRRFDPSRPATFALLVGPVVSPALERTADLSEIIFLNQYYGWYFGRPEGVGGLLDRFHEKYPDKPIIVSEFGAGAVRGRHSDPPLKFTEDYQAFFYEVQFAEILSRPFVHGTMPWVFSDFRCPWFKEEHPVYEMNLKGLVDYHRNKKAAFEVVRGIYSGLAERAGRGTPESPSPRGH